MTKTSPLSSDAIKTIRATREAEERRFLAHTLDYLRESAIGGDVHEYGCDRRPVLPLIADLTKSAPIAGMKLFGFATFETPRVIPSRGNKSDAPFETFMTQKELEAATGGKAILSAGAPPKTLSRAERDRFMNTENKVALAIIRSATGAEAKTVLEFVEPLLTEGSVVYFADLFAGYRRTGAKEVGRAFIEFQQNARFRYLRHMDIGWWGRSYVACLPVDLPFERL